MANNQHPNAPADPKREEPARYDPKRAEYLADTYGFTTGQINVVRNAICVGATDAELEFFLATCKRVALDPFARQIWFVKRRQRVEDSQGNESWVDVGRPETSIDGFRTIAERTGEYEGQAPIQWCDAKGQWRDVWIATEPPHAARATVYRKGFKEPMVSVALLTEYRPVYRNGKSPAMWLKMPANQLGVRAEAQALRRAFPRDLSGLITDGEGEAMEVGASAFSAPAKPEPKQIEQRKPDPAAKIVSATPSAEDAGEMVVPREAATEVLAEIAADETLDDLDREIARLLKSVTGAQSRDELQEAGHAVTEAKKARDKDDSNAWANAVVDVIKPALEKRWRELPPSKGTKK